MKSILLTCIVFFLSLVPAHSQNESNLNVYAQWKNGPSSDPDYFPIAVWLQDPKNAAKYKAAGINLYVGLWRGPTEAQLSTLQKTGMQVVCDQNTVGLAHKDDRTIVGWMHGDEPDNAQPVTDPDTGERTYGPPVPPADIVADYEELKERDPSRPILLNLGQGVANDEWKGRGAWGKQSDYLTYVKGCDLLSFDVYPVVGIRKTDGENYLWYVPKGVDRLIEWSEGKKIVWNCIECTHISNEEKKATPHQVKAEVWMSIIHGSMGLIYFVHEFAPQFNEDALLDDPEMLEAVTKLNNQIHALAPVLNSTTINGKVEVSVSDPETPVDIMLKHYNGAAYLFAVGMRNNPTKATFILDDLPSETKIEVLYEDRTINAVNGQFEDPFNAYDVHIYKFTKQIQSSCSSALLRETLN